ncbi:hypothetical protein [Endozoicomonas acroporae]|uniref:hypothetical protein n=1 Tax=Endozoicomonas acroporae TaxID=1701104 RepID=UPI0013D7356B|nr:hypothetical protein [Endozoicomonas acroporae]
MDSLSDSLKSLEVGSAVPGGSDAMSAFGSASAIVWGRELAVVNVSSPACSGLPDATFPDAAPCTSATVVSDHGPGLLMGNPVNSEKNNHLSSREKVVAVMSAFGTSHPFDSRAIMRILAACICDEEEQLSPFVSNGKKCNFLLSGFLALQYAGEPEATEPILAKLKNIDKDFLDLYLRAVELYLLISGQSPSSMDYEQVQELSQLVRETEFFPAAWLLVKLSCNTDKLLLVSPFLIPRLLVPFMSRSAEMIMLQRTFARELMDAFTTLLKLTNKNFNSCLEKMTPRDLFMMDLGGLLMGANTKPEFKAFADYPEGLRQIITLDWSDIIRSRQEGGRLELRSRRNRYNHNDLRQVFEETGAKLRVSKGTINNLLGGVFKDAGKGDTKRRLYKYFEQHLETQESRFVIGLMKLTKGLMYLCSTGFEKHPLIALIHLANAADSGLSPLLLKDAGDINLGFGRFEKSRELYQKLRSLPGLPESLRRRLDSLIEICELNIPAITSTAASDAVKTPVVVEAGSTKSRKKRTTRQRSRTEFRGDVVAPKQRSPDTEQTPEVSRPVEQRHLPSVSDLPEQSDSDDRKHPDKPPEAVQIDQLSPVTPFRPAPEKLVGTTAPRQLFMPREGRFSDSDLMVQRFVREINAHRNKSDLASEKLCIEQWLMQDRVYGRVCEDAAWFYLRQCIFPEQMNAVILVGDKLNDEKEAKWQMLHFALDWVSRAMACYLAQPIEKRILSGRLQEMLIQRHHQNPEQKKDAEACKRLRSGCSGFGHVFSELSGLVSSHKLRKVYDDKGHEFFALKRIADPLYYLGV